jgi:hypothetical protein
MLKMTYSYRNLLKDLPSLYERIDSDLLKGSYTYTSGEAGSLKVYMTFSNSLGNTYYWVEISNDGQVNNCVIPQNLLASVYDWIKSITYCKKRQTERLLLIKEELLSKACNPVN